jgi:glutaconate CoA-transferase subunit B
LTVAADPSIEPSRGSSLAAAAPLDVTPDDQMTVVAARALANGTRCFVGIGLPSRASNLARRLHAPQCVLVYESGTIGAKPTRLPLSIGDNELAETADAVVSVPEIFNYWLQARRIEVGFLGAAQIDRRGHINTTVVGDYDHPAVRLPGAGGAPEIATGCDRIIVVLRHSTKSFVDQVDFITSAPRPEQVITDLGVLRPDPVGGDLVLTAVHPGVEVDTVRAATGWNLAVAEPLARTAPPGPEELAALRALQP